MQSLRDCYAVWLEYTMKKKTPKYEISIDVIKKNYEFICKKLCTCNIFYAMKANSAGGVIEILDELGANFECSSKEEYDLLRVMKIDNSRIEFALPIKSIDLIKYLYGQGCRLFVFDGINELRKLEEFAPDSRKIMRLFITDIAEHSIKFGTNVHDMCNVFGDKMSLIDGICFHISENTSIKQLVDVVNRAEMAIDILRSEGKKERLILNIGGGFSYQAEDGYYDVLNEKLNTLKHKYNVHIIAEPGTIITRTAGKYITKVISVISHEQFTEVFIDGGMPHGVIFPPNRISIFSGEKIKSKRKIYRFIDNTCMRKELFIKGLLYDIYEGDILVFEDYGAYSNMFQNDFHRWSRAEVVYK